MRSIEKEGTQIVMLGAFNPTIFQPRWLGSVELIRPEEAKNAQIATIQAQVADFTTDWFRMQVLQNRFLLQSLDATHYGPLRDLVAGIFNLLPHTPVNRMAIGKWFHYKMDTAEAWHDVGNKLAPKEFWNPLMEGAGLRSMMMQGRRPDGESGTLFVKVEPSNLVTPGVFIDVTEDFMRFREEEVADAQWVAGRLDKHWDPMMKYAEEVAEGLLLAVAHK